MDFKYKSKGLTVYFDYVGVTPPGFSLYWEFGDGNTSNELSPTHTYENSDFYQVRVFLKNSSLQTVDTASTEIGVSDRLKTTLSDSIYNLIDEYIPSDSFGTLTYKRKQFYIQKWQLYLQPLVNHFIPVEEYANEMYYEALENQLIMELAAYDFMMVEISNMLKSIGSMVIPSKESQNSQISSEKGGIKKITTGPTEVEYFDNNSQISDNISSLTKFLQSDGVIDTIKDNICLLAARLEIYLPICKAPNSKKVVPKVVNRRVPEFLKGPDPIEITR